MSFSKKVKDPDPKGLSKLDSNLVAIIDLDYVKYTVASVGEKRTIKVIHKESGKEILNTVIEDGKKVKRPFKNRTEFWGRGKKIGGKLLELNELAEEKGRPLASKEDFEIEDIQTPEPIKNVLHTAKSMVERDLKSLGTANQESYLGKGDSFRVGLSTLMEYKGNRENLIKPLLLTEVTEYLGDTFKATTVTGIEADDAVVIRAYGDPNAVILGVDKDYRGQPVKYFDVNNPKEGIINGDCFGKLWDTGKKISGYGRLFLLFQMISQDNTDNYKFNCASEVQWGEKSAYKALKDCKNDQEAWEAVVEVLNTVYPEPTAVETWRGTEVLIDGWYVINEMFNMARMKTHENDFTTLQEWLNQYGVDNNYKVILDD